MSDDHIIKIYNRQLLTYEELMDFEIGAYRVNKYGSENLDNCSKNQPSIAEEEVIGVLAMFIFIEFIENKPECGGLALRRMGR